MTDVIIIAAAVTSAVVTVIGGLYKSVPVVRKSRLVLLAGTKVRKLRDWYAVRRISKPIANWFKSYCIQGLNIRDYRRALESDSRTILGTFSVMQLKRPSLTPRLNDYLIAHAVKRLARKGKVVWLPQWKLIGPFLNLKYEPAEAEIWNIAYNKDPKEAETRKSKSEEERCCIEYHYSFGGKSCPRIRYTFQPWTTTEGNTTRSGINSLLQDGAGDCERCWERD